MTDLALATTKVRNSRIFERQAEDWYVEPAWVWERLFDHLGFRAGTKVLDPACGGGTSIEAACRYGLDGRGSDVVPRWVASGARLGLYRERDCFQAMRDCDAEVIVSNPPFKIAREFAEAAIEATPTVCLLLPCKWACGDARARWLAKTPLSDILFLTPRPSMPPGANLLTGEKPGGGTVDFAVFCWWSGQRQPASVGWLHRDGEAA